MSSEWSIEWRIPHLYEIFRTRNMKQAKEIACKSSLTGFCILYYILGHRLYRRGCVFVSIAERQDRKYFH